MGGEMLGRRDRRARPFVARLLHVRLKFGLQTFFLRSCNAGRATGSFGARRVVPGAGCLCPEPGMGCSGRDVLQYALQDAMGRPAREDGMPRSARRKEYPLSMRFPEADIAMIDRAAGLRGRSRTDFVREAAVRAAEDVLMENIPIRMSPEGFETFLRVLARPAKPVAEMVELARRRAPWEPAKRKREN